MGGMARTRIGFSTTTAWRRKPSPENSQELYLDSLRALGIDPMAHDIRFVEDDWESPTLGPGAWAGKFGDGMEVSQFTYFQQVGGHDCNPVSVELTYGLERLAMYVLGIENVMDMIFDPQTPIALSYGDVFHQAEVEYSTHNFEYADVDMLRRHFEDAMRRRSLQRCSEAGRIIMAHRHTINA